MRYGILSRKERIVTPPRWCLAGLLGLTLLVLAGCKREEQVPPASGPGPVTNKARRKDNGQSDYGMLVGDYANPILQPWAADVVKKKGELSLAGVTIRVPPTSAGRSRCRSCSSTWPCR